MTKNTYNRICEDLKQPKSNYFGCLFSAYCKKDYIHHNCDKCVYEKGHRIGITCGMMYRIPYHKWKRCHNWNYDSNYILKSIIMKNQNKKLTGFKKYE